MPMTTQLGRVVTYIQGLLFIKLHDHLVTWSSRFMLQTKNIPTATMPMATKFGWVVAYLKRLLPMK